MKFELGGDDWTFKGFISEDWRWRRAHLPDSPDLRWYWPASVPGSVTNDLWWAGQIPDPYYERNIYTFVANGRRVYAKGWNWVPIDVLYGVPRPEKLARLLELARRAHVNLRRVWGVGLIETEAFYKLCDRYGILVWQEFIRSSSGMDNHPPEDAEFAAMLIAQAEQIIPRRRNHPSLSEFGVEGYTKKRTIEAHIAPANRWPATRDNPAYFHTASWWIKEGTLQAACGDLLLLPGESRMIVAEWHNIPEPDRRLQVQGWNTPAVAFFVIA
jgi:Glycosyl hydrolases family 2, TIM barrel domain